MAQGDARAVLERALTVGVCGDAAAAIECFTEDVSVRSPVLAVSSRAALVAAQFSRFGAFSDVELTANVDLVDDRGYAEWVLAVTHSAPFALEDVVVEATGNRVTLHGAAVAEFEGERIRSLRLYWDEVELRAGLGLATGTAPR
jgi:SnoaL-like domain